MGPIYDFKHGFKEKFAKVQNMGKNVQIYICVHLYSEICIFMRYKINARFIRILQFVDISYPFFRRSPKTHIESRGPVAL